MPACSRMLRSVPIGKSLPSFPGFDYFAHLPWHSGCTPALSSARPSVSQGSNGSGCHRQCSVIAGRLEAVVYRSHVGPAPSSKARISDGPSDWPSSSSRAQRVPCNSVYVVCMGRVNITVPDELLDQAKAAGLNVSRFAAGALAEELERRAKVVELDAYLADLDVEFGSIPQQEVVAAREWAA